MRTYVIAVMGAMAALTATGCHKPSQSHAPTEQTDRDRWSEPQRQAFDAALEVARENLYRQLRQLRVTEKARMDDLVKEVAVTQGELRSLSKTARFRRITWLSDGRCRVEIDLAMFHVVEAMDRWDAKKRWAPHDQLVQLNGRPILSAAGESAAPGLRSRTR